MVGERADDGDVAHDGDLYLVLSAAVHLEHDPVVEYGSAPAAASTPRAGDLYLARR